MPVIETLVEPTVEPDLFQSETERTDVLNAETAQPRQ